MNIKLKKEQHLFEIEIFCKIINVFTVTFDQLNVSLIIIHFLEEENLTDPKHLDDSVFLAYVSHLY